MKTIQANGQRTLSLGRVGEDERTEIVFDISDVASEFPSGSVTLVHRCPNNTDAHPVTVVRNGNNVVWTVADDELSADGYGECQLTYSFTDGRSKSKIWQTVIGRSLVNNNTAPAPYTSWLDNLTTLANQTQTNATKAETALSTLENKIASGQFKGEKGDTGSQGPKGDTGSQGPAGSAGTDGVSPTVSTSKTGNTTTITITDANGTHTAQIVDGNDGQNGRDGSDASVTSSNIASALGYTPASESSVTSLSGHIGEVDSDLVDHGSRITMLESLHHLEDMSISDIASIVRSGEASNFFNIGDQLTTKWTDHVNNRDYDFVWDVVAFKNVDLEDGTTKPGMVLQSHYATPFAIPFDNRAFYYASDGLPAGTYHITIGTTWGSTMCIAGKTYQFTLANDVPAGGQLSGFYRAPDVTIDGCRVHSWASPSATVPIETVIPIEGSDGTSLGTYYSNKTDNAEKQNYLQSIAYGHNRWSKSAYRQYLNSNAAAGSWWNYTDNFDRQPQGNGTTPSYEFINRHGFVAGFTDDFLSALRPVKVQTSCNTLTDGGITDTTFDTFFLPSLEEIYISPQIAGIEGNYWQYWKERTAASAPQAQYKAYPERITYAVENHASAQNCRVRSANRGTSYVVWIVSSTGNVNGYAASAALRCAPACVIC